MAARQASRALPQIGAVPISVVSVRLFHARSVRPSSGNQSTCAIWLVVLCSAVNVVGGV